MVSERHAPELQPHGFRTHPRPRHTQRVPQSQHMMQDWLDRSDLTWKSCGCYTASEKTPVIGLVRRVQG